MSNSVVRYKCGRRAEVDGRDGMRERERKEEEDGEKNKLEWSPFFPVLNASIQTPTASSGV